MTYPSVLIFTCNIDGQGRLLTQNWVDLFGDAHAYKGGEVAKLQGVRDGPAIQGRRSKRDGHTSLASTLWGMADLDEQSVPLSRAGINARTSTVVRI